MMLLTFLGTSDAQGVPRLLCDCGVCTSDDSVHKRNRPSVSIQVQDQSVWIDLSPDFREQFRLYGQRRIPDTVLITHCHHDHIGGLGDFADLCFWNRHVAQVVSPAGNIERLKRQYPYLQRRPGLEFVPETTWRIGQWSVSFHRVNHGHNGSAYGILFQSGHGKWAYVPDAFDVTAEQWQPFADCDLLILGTSYYREQAERTRRSVYDVTEAIELKQTLNAGRMVLTHLSHGIDIPYHSQMLPDGVQFAHDCLTLEL